LIDQFREQHTPALDKLDFAFSAVYPMSWGVKLELARNYEKIGVHMSAYELLKTIGMHEEAVRSLYLAGREGRAIAMVDELMATSEIKNYNLLCLVGDMKKDPSWYEKAWEESGHKCSKAMRYLGRYRFNEGKFKEAAECYEKALKVNRLYPDAWFTMGCCYMRADDYKNAAYAFSQVVSIDDR
jgi:tetratricopeptide (TPR) repeat protein